MGKKKEKKKEERGGIQEQSELEQPEAKDKGVYKGTSHTEFWLQQWKANSL